MLRGFGHDAVRVGVAEDDRPATSLDDVEGRALADVGAIEQQSHPVGLLDNELAKAGQSAVIIIERAATDAIRGVVGGEHHAQTEQVEGLDAMQLAVDEVAVLRRHDDG